MWEFKLAALTFTLLTLGLVSFKFVTSNKTITKASAAAILDDEDELRNALEIVVNGTVPSESIREKIYTFFYDLTMAQQMNDRDKLNSIKKANKRRFLLDLIPVIREPSLTKTGLIRYRRECDEEEKNFRSQKKAKEEERRKLLIRHENELEKLKESLCKDRCEYKCEQFKCPMPNCPAIPKDPNICAEHSMNNCPQGCDKVIHETSEIDKSRTTTSKPKPEPSSTTKTVKNSRVHKGSRQKRTLLELPDLDNSHFSFFHKSEIRFKSVISDLDEGSRKVYLQKLKNLASSGKIKRETIMDMFDILKYLTKNEKNKPDEKSKNPIQRMFKKVKDSKKGEIMFRGIKVILGYVMPSNLMSSKIIQQFSARVSKRFKREGGKQKRLETLLDNSDDPYGCFVCSPMCSKTYLNGCDFNCDNNSGCQAYECRCHLFKSDFHAHIK